MSDYSEKVTRQNQDVVAVIPRVFPGKHATHANGFTIGVKYPIIPGTLSLSGSQAVVLNDNGHERVVNLDGGPSPLIPKSPA